VPKRGEALVEHLVPDGAGRGGRAGVVDDLLGELRDRGGKTLLEELEHHSVEDRDQPLQLRAAAGEERDAEVVARLLQEGERAFLHLGVRILEALELRAQAVLVPAEDVEERLIRVVHHAGLGLTRGDLLVQLGLEEEAAEALGGALHGHLDQDRGCVGAEHAIEQEDERARLLLRAALAARRRALRGDLALHRLQLLDDLRGDRVELRVRLHLRLVVDDPRLDLLLAEGHRELREIVDLGGIGLLRLRGRRGFFRRRRRRRLGRPGLAHRSG
jgi:hypothetical protein